MINYEEFYRILWRSIKDAQHWKPIKWLLTGSIGSFTGLLKFGENFFSWDLKRSVIFGILAIAALYMLRLLVIFLKESIKYIHKVYKESVYGEAIIILKNSFALAHSFRKRNTHDDVEFMSIMMEFCNNLRDIYNKITFSECSVSIKVPRYDPSVSEHTVLTNLTRDVKHKSRDTKQYDEIKHTLLGNTAFRFCFNKVMINAKEKHYLNNKVNETDHYDNTSRECHPNNILPYNSEIVVPIVPIKPPEKQNECHGFLCVDCEKKDAFNTNYDVGLLEGVADGVYDLISKRNSFHYNNKSQDDNEIHNSPSEL